MMGKYENSLVACLIIATYSLCQENASNHFNLNPDRDKSSQIQ